MWNVSEIDNAVRLCERECVECCCACDGECLSLEQEVVYGPRPMLIPLNWGLGTPENSEQKRRIAANRRCVYPEIIRTTSRRGRTGVAQCLGTETLVSICMHGVQGLHSSNHCKHWPMLGHYHRKRLDALPLMLSESYRRDANPFHCRRPRLAMVRNTRIRFVDSSQTCMKFRLFRIVRFVLTFSFDFFLCIKKARISSNFMYSQ